MADADYSRTSADESPSGKIRMVIVATHPIQYQAPLYRRLAQSAVVELHVAFLTDFGLRPSYDPGFGRSIAFDVPLTDGYNHSFLSTGHTDRPKWWALPPLGQLRKHLSRADVVVPPAYGTLAAWACYVLAGLARTPYLVRCDSQVEPDRSPTGFRRRLKRHVLGPVLRRSAACLAIGSSNAAFFQNYGVPPARLVRAPYSVDNNFFAAEGELGRDKRREMLESVGLDPRLPVVCFAAKLQPYKRPLDLVAAFSRLRTKANLVFIGDGPLRTEIECGVAKLDHSCLLGFVNQSVIGRWYGASDVVVLPSDREPWGLAVNEAMASGAVPVLSSAVGCGPDLVLPGGGEIYPVGDVSALAAAVDRLLESSEALSSARAVARRAVDLHSIEATARGFEEGALRAMSANRPGRD